MYFAFISSFLSRNVFFCLHLAKQVILHSDGLLISQQQPILDHTILDCGLYEFIYFNAACFCFLYEYFFLVDIILLGCVSVFFLFYFFFLACHVPFPAVVFV